MRGVTKVKGFTLIELIVVIVIIGILAAILIPSLVTYARNAKISQYNSNAKSIYSGAQLAITDITKTGKTVEPDTIYICKSVGNGLCIAAGSTEECDITDYLGENFGGYFGFMTDAGGTGCVYAMWSSGSITAADLQNQMTMDEVEDSFSSTPRGCHPLKIET